MLDVSVAGEIFAAPGAPKCLEAIRDACADGSERSAHRSESCGRCAFGQHRHGSRAPRGPANKDGAHRRGYFRPAGRSSRAGGLRCWYIKLQALRQNKGRRSKHATRSRIACSATCAPWPSPFELRLIPRPGKPIFEMGDDEMEIGMGQHGEAGAGRMQLKTADETAEIMLEKLLEDLAVVGGRGAAGDVQRRRGDNALMELYLVFRRVAQLLEAKKIRLARSVIGEFITTQEQAGFQMTIARMDERVAGAVGCAGGCAVLRKIMRHTSTKCGTGANVCQRLQH